MRDAVPTRRDVWLAGVLPTAIAMLVAGLLLVERLQTDLALADRYSFPSVWLSFLVAFALAHILGVSSLAGATATGGSKMARVGRMAAFLTLHTPGLPFLPFGGYLLFMQSLFLLPLMLAVGFDGPPQPYQQNLIYQILAVWPLLAATQALPGVIFGAVLALSAGPGWRSLVRADWKRLLVAYCIGGLVAMHVMTWMSEYVVSYYLRGERNPLFDKDHAWPGALIAYLAVIMACASIWVAALQAYSTSAIVLWRRECWLGIGSLILLAGVLAAVTHVAAGNGVILLGDNADGSNPIANFVRSNQPTLAPRALNFHGVYFIGPRSVLKHKWDRLVLQSSEWKPQLWSKNMFGEDIDVGMSTDTDKRPSDCRPLSATMSVCADLALANTRISGGRADIETYQYDTAIPEAALRNRLSGPRNAPATLNDLHQREGHGCRIELKGVPVEGLKTEAWIDCGPTWPAEARRLKALVGSWFGKEPR
jgi:hypothetical protein